MNAQTTTHTPTTTNSSILSSSVHNLSNVTDSQDNTLTTATASTSSILTKIAHLMKDCHYITKNGKNSFHGYSYVTGADVLERVNLSMSEHGLVSIASPTLIDFREIQTAKGNIDKLATVKVNITLYDTESGESLQISGIGSGQDTGDKAIMKAETAAIKYAYMLSLCIATGDDPEADRSTDEATQFTTNHLTNNNSLAKSRSQTYSPPSKQSNESLVCSDCSTSLTTKVSSFSMSKYGVPLCMNCQKAHHKTA